MKKLEDLIEFCEKTGSFPYSRTKNKEEKSLYWFSWKNKEDPRIIKLKRKYAKRQRYKISLDDFVDYCEKNQKFPGQRKKEDLPYYYFYIKNKENPIVYALKREYKKGKVSLKVLEEFCEKNNKLPGTRSGNTQERRLYLFTLENKEMEEIKELRERYGRKFITIQDVRDFCENYHRFPKQLSENKEEVRLYFFYKRNNKNEELQELRRQYKNHRLKTL